MIVLDVDRRRFQMRAAAIIRRDGHVLIHRATHEAFWTLPGGRVEFGESSAQTLGREIAEELGVTSRVGALSLLVENFFVYDGWDVHELGFYHEVELTGPFPFVLGEVCHRVIDGGAELEFEWVPCEAAALRSQGVLPAELIEPLASGAAFCHLIVRQTEELVQ